MKQASRRFAPAGGYVAGREGFEPSRGLLP